MRNYQVTLRPFIVEANSMEEAKVKAMFETTVQIVEVARLDSILEDVLRDDAALFMESLPKA